MTKVHIVECCFADETEEIIGPFADLKDAKVVAEAIADHFYDGGDEYTRVRTREVRE